MGPEADLAAAASPVTLGFNSFKIDSDATGLAEMFSARRALATVGLFEPGFLASLSRIAAQAAYAPRDDLDRGGRLWEEPGTASKAVTLALQRRPFLDWLEKVTGCGPLATVYGDIMESPYNSNRFGWHDDVPPEEDPLRRLGVTIDFSLTPFEGGAFEMRMKADKSTLIHHRHRTPGSVLVFEVGKHIEHRVEPVTGGGPRRVYTGWFQRGAVRCDGRAAP